jgi:hypothetical protein
MKKYKEFHEAMIELNKLTKARPEAISTLKQQD